MNRRGLTLLEVLVVVMVMAPITITILAALGQGRLSRTNTATRLAALQTVQQELDVQRIRLASGASTDSLPQPGEPIVSSSSLRLRSGTTAVLTLTRSIHPTGLILLDGEVSFPDSIEGLSPVHLTTLAAPASNPVRAPEVRP